MSPDAPAGHPIHPPRIPRIAWPLIAAAAVIVAGAWAVTIASMDTFNALLMSQMGGGSPGNALAFIALTGVMMAAMMLPSALPMIEAHRGIVTLDRGPRAASVESVAFGVGYLAVWTATTALALPVLAAVGALPPMGGAALFVPAAVVLAAGIYQFTSWKRFCLRHCRAPVDYLATHYRKGRAGALRAGLEHGGYCLGCCWLLMLVWFVAGAMGLVWMGVFAALILAEKVSSRGEVVSRGIGVAAIAAGLLMMALGASAPSM